MLWEIMIKLLGFQDGNQRDFEQIQRQILAHWSILDVTIIISRSSLIPDRPARDWYLE